MIPYFEIKKLQVTNFRNLSNDIFSFDSGVNCIVGNNGQGKTNVLEAIYLLCTHKSFRKKTAFPQLISVDSVKPEILLSGVMEFESEKRFSTLHITQKKMEQSIDSKKIRKKELTPAIFIGPFDFHRFNYESDFRRSWFDTNLILVNRPYSMALTRYQKYVRQRNRLLAKQPEAYLSQIEALDRSVLTDILLIERERRQFAAEIGEYGNESYKEFFEESFDLSVEYCGKYELNSEEELKNEIEKNLEKDKLLGFTRNGPHRESFSIKVNGLELENYCSVGQQKTAYISLIFAYISLFRYKRTSYPMVLIDDISGELDRERWQRFVGYFARKKFQVILTTANKDFEQEIKKIENSNLINIDSGKIA